MEDGSLTMAGDLGPVLLLTDKNQEKIDNCTAHMVRVSTMGPPKLDALDHASLHI